MNAYKLIPQEALGDMVYFKQTADIDMAGIENYQALNGWYGKYFGKFTYDGNYHLIKNFAPKDRAPKGGEPENNGVKDAYYCQTLFGVASGVIKNLGVVDCNIADAAQGAGALGAYAGHSASQTGVTVDNVFVTGSVKGTNYTGGFFGTSGGDISIKNSYAVVDVEGSYAGGLIGRLRNTTEVAESYIDAKVAICENADPSKQGKGLIAATDKTPAVTVSKVMVIGSGDAFSSGITATGKPMLSATMDDATKQSIQKLPAFTDKKEVKGYPTLNWMNAEQIEAAGVEDVIVDNDENAPVEYFNLQGVRIENPAKGGLYIKRQGNTATKVIVR